MRIRTIAELEIDEYNQNLIRRPTKRHDACDDNAQTTDSSVGRQVLISVLVLFIKLLTSFRHLQQPDTGETIVTRMTTVNKRRCLEALIMITAELCDRQTCNINGQDLHSFVFWPSKLFIPLSLMN